MRNTKNCAYLKWKANELGHNSELKSTIKRHETKLAVKTFQLFVDRGNAINAILAELNFQRDISQKILQKKEIQMFYSVGQKLHCKQGVIEPTVDVNSLVLLTQNLEMCKNFWTMVERGRGVVEYMKIKHAYDETKQVHLPRQKKSDGKRPLRHCSKKTNSAINKYLANLEIQDFIHLIW